MNSSGRPVRAWRRTMVALTVFGLALGLMTGPVASSAAEDRSGEPTPDGASVSGYDGVLPDRAARVIARGRTNLVFRYVATSGLRNGTVALDVPRAAWPDPLEAYGDGLAASPAYYGLAVVRPLAGQEQANDCRAGAAGPISWTVDRSRVVQRVVVEHVDCEPGQQLLIRLFGITAPRKPGVYPFSLTVDDATGGEGQILSLQVHPQPSTKLSVSLPRRVQFDTPVTLVVKALRSDGSIDRSYRGGVALLSDRIPGCTFDGAYADDVYDFTAADEGVHEFTVSFANGGFRVVARDVGREARPGKSNRFEVADDRDEPSISCPVSFH